MIYLNPQQSKNLSSILHSAAAMGWTAKLSAVGDTANGDRAVIVEQVGQDAYTGNYAVKLLADGTMEKAS